MYAQTLKPQIDPIEALANNDLTDWDKQIDEVETLLSSLDTLADFTIDDINHFIDTPELQRIEAQEAQDDNGMEVCI